MSIGTFSPPVGASALLRIAQEAATSLEALLLQAHRIANNVVSGWHGRRQQGSGDSFWQFRPYRPGEATSHIDWRRCARGHSLYIREREWEAAQTVFVCPDLSLSMRYQSRFAPHSKEAHAILLSLVLTQLLLQSGERVGVPHLLAPTSSRHGTQRLALALQAADKGEASFDFSALPPHAHAIVLSDFLDSPAKIETKFSLLAKHHIKAYVVEIADPAEERFPYRGHVEFQALETGETITIGRADHVARDYKSLYLARRRALVDLAHRHGWSFYTSLTDKPLAPTLHHLSLNLRERDER